MSKTLAKIPLQGGLGNQLFQLSALLSLGCESNHLECAWGNPRQTSGVEDIFYYKLEGIAARAETKRFRKFLLKGFNFILRFFLKPSPVIIKNAIRWLWEKVVNTMLLQNYNFQASNELGFFQFQKSKNQKFLLHGYFQSYRYFENPKVKSRMQNLILKTPPIYLEDYKMLAAAELPLVVHVRRGDYKSESNFGLLGAGYYENALTKIWNPKAFNKIWLFSDEPESALQVIPVSLRDKVRVIPDLDSVPASTLELMRLGHGYVIANSSFSWWGASLSRNSEVQVVAPSKWFKGMTDPADLIPGDWLRADSNFL